METHVIFSCEWILLDCRVLFIVGIMIGIVAICYDNDNNNNDPDNGDNDDDDDNNDYDYS